MKTCVDCMNFRVALSNSLFAAVLACGLATFASAHAQDVTAPVPPPSADPKGEAVVAKLLSQMTMDEKIGQMSQIPLNQPPPLPPDQLAAEGKVGSFLFITDAAEINRLQHVAVEKSRLHIPLLFGFDVIHGFRTIYPVPIAMASSWDPAVAEKAQSMAAKEASATGVMWTFAPMVDIARDPRWGRIMEGAGEDPFLGAKMAAARCAASRETSKAPAISLPASSTSPATVLPWAVATTKSPTSLTNSCGTSTSRPSTLLSPPDPAPL